MTGYFKMPFQCSFCHRFYKIREAHAKRCKPLRDYIERHTPKVLSPEQEKIVKERQAIGLKNFKERFG